MENSIAVMKDLNKNNANFNRESGKVNELIFTITGALEKTL